jgi:hypothetical protein
MRYQLLRTVERKRGEPSMIPNVGDFPFVALIITLLLVSILGHLSSKLVTFVSHLSSGRGGKLDKKEDLLQLLVLAELLNFNSDESILRPSNFTGEGEHFADRGKEVGE